jgi:hypothetical protein
MAECFLVQQSVRARERKKKRGRESESQCVCGRMCVRQVTSVAFSPDLLLLAAACADNTVRACVCMLTTRYADSTCM